MVLFKSLIPIALIRGVAAASSQYGTLGCGEVNVFFTYVSELWLFLQIAKSPSPSGLPANHPIVISSGIDKAAAVATAMRNDAAYIIQAGYNLRGKQKNNNMQHVLKFKRADEDLHIVALMGPEQSETVFLDQLRGVHWDGTGIGFGYRGSDRSDLTIRSEGEQWTTRFSTYPITASTKIRVLCLDYIQFYREYAPRAPIMFNSEAGPFLTALQRRLPLPSNCTGSPGKDLVSQEFLLQI